MSYLSMEVEKLSKTKLCSNTTFPFTIQSNMYVENSAAVYNLIPYSRKMSHPRQKYILV